MLKLTHLRTEEPFGREGGRWLTCGQLVLLTQSLMPLSSLVPLLLLQLELATGCALCGGPRGPQGAGRQSAHLYPPCRLQEKRGLRELRSLEKLRNLTQETSQDTLPMCEDALRDGLGPVLQRCEPEEGWVGGWGHPGPSWSDLPALNLLEGHSFRGSPTPYFCAGDLGRSGFVLGGPCLLVSCSPGLVPGPVGTGGDPRDISQFGAPWIPPG